MSTRTRALLAVVAVVLTAVVASMFLRTPPVDPPPTAPAPVPAATLPSPVRDSAPSPPPPPAAPEPAVPPPAATAIEEEAARLADQAEEEGRRKAEAEEREAAVDRVLRSRLVACDFDETSFLDAVRVLSEQQGVRMTVDSDLFSQVADVKVTFKFKSANLAKVLRTLAALSGAVAEADGDGIRFRKLESVESPK